MQLIIYTDDDRYSMHTKEYQIIWELEGKNIETAFEKILGLKFCEKEIKLLINDGKNGSNFSGNSKSENMNFRYNNRCKIGTFLHELSHRIIMEYNLFDVAKRIEGFSDIHELIDLFLYDIIELLYGENAAKMRVEYESNFEEDLYKNSWNKALLLSYKERQKKLKRIVEESK